MAAQRTGGTVTPRALDRIIAKAHIYSYGEGPKYLMSTKRILKRFPRLYAAYRAYRDSRLLKRPPSRTPLGFWLAGNEAMQTGEFETTETQVVQQLLPEVDVLINVGANIGYYCCIALEMGKQVVAFEPLPANLRALMRNMELNQWSEAIEIFPLALGNRIGVIDIYGGGTAASLVEGWAGQSADEALQVPISTLDTVCGQRFRNTRCMLLVDVEGAELSMLQGATKLLNNDPKPIWMVEISVTEHQPSGVQINPHLVQTFQLFDQFGYQAFTADLQSRPVALAEVQRVFDTGVDTLQTHNFLFRDTAAGTVNPPIE